MPTLVRRLASIAQSLDHPEVGSDVRQSVEWTASVVGPAALDPFQALDRTKAERKEARDEAAKAGRDALHAKLDRKEAEHTAAQLKAAAEKAALHKANDESRRERCLPAGHRRSGSAWRAWPHATQSSRPRA